MTVISQTHVRSGDAEIYVETRGSGPDVLLLCGLGDTVEVWSAQSEPLSDRYRVSVIDNRGVGRTRAPVESITVPNLAADAAAVIEALGLDTPHVMGFSGGGMIAQELAITRPELVRSLVLNGTFAEMDELAHRKLEAWLHLAATSETPVAWMRHFLSAIYSRAAHADGRADAWAAELLAFEPAMSDEAFVATVEAFRRHSTADRLHRISAPALVVVGEEDINASPSYSRDIAAAIPDAELVVLPDQGHQPFQEIPEEFNALVTGFWERVTA
ncbi:MAG: alpha/beta hydrolase [Actinomycetota bacterium]|nr:alpha/beta hydrolase [Actinomycetota bacterium]MDQ5808131.1 alpha/beta hydrolase [Actinomycetota bacterium]